MTTKRFSYIVNIDTDTEDHADQILAERIGFDEEVRELLPDGSFGEFIEYTIGTPLNTAEQIAATKRVLASWNQEDAA